MILDVAYHRLFKPPQITDIPPEFGNQFLKFKYFNKGIDVVNLSNILRSRQSTDKQVYVTGISTVSFTGSFPQILW
jgi:hypothetical protein